MLENKTKYLASLKIIKQKKQNKKKQQLTICYRYGMYTSLENPG